MKKLSFYGLLLFLIQPGSVFTQQIFEHITTADGLSNNTVNSVLQDKDGFYWIATSDGLNRFDGSDFKIFRNEKNNPYSLAHNLCNSLIEDDAGNIWIATYNGLSVYKKKEGRFQNIYIQHPGLKPDILNRFVTLTKDDNGNIWAGAHFLVKYNTSDGTLQYFIHNPNDKNSISDGSGIASIFYDKRNKGIWAMTADHPIFFDMQIKKFQHQKNNYRKWKIFETRIAGKIAMDDNATKLWFYNSDRGAFCFFDLTTYQVGESPIKKPSYARNIQVDNQGRLCISFWRDIDKSFIYDPAKGTVDSSFLGQFHSRSALSPRFNHLYTDKFNNIWIGSGSGVSIYNPSYQFLNLYELNAPLTQENHDAVYITAIAPSGPTSVWIGLNKKGLYHFNRLTRLLTRINEQLIDFPVECLYAQNDSILWLNSSTTLYKLDCRTKKIIKEKPADMMIQFITADNYGNIWIGDWLNGLYKLNSDGDVLKHYVHDPANPGSLPFNNLICGNFQLNNLWIGMNGGNGFVQFDPANDKFIHFNPITSDSSNKDYGTINSIATADGNTFMIGTHGGGIYLWNRKTNTYKQFTENDGMDGVFINSVLPDKKGNYWISTSNGINFFDHRIQKFTRIKIDFSFTTNAVSLNGVTDADGNVLMFCNKRLIEIKPSLYNISPTSTRTLISSFKVFDKDLSSSLVDSVIHLTYKQNFFSFEYSALKSNPEADAKYAYKLEGFDENWNEAGTRRYAAYTNVPAGHYRFLVKTLDEAGGGSSRITSITIVILPPFWKTWWFITLAAMLIMTTLYLLYRYRVAQVKKVFTLRSKISQDLHDEIGATLSSIHVYSSVAAKAIDKNPEKSLDALEHIHSNTRQVMENMSDIVWAINANNSGETSLEGKLKNYGYELLTPLNIQCIYWIDKDTDKRLTNIEARKNLLLIIKEAMNNIAKYSNATEAMVKLEFKGKNLQLEVADNGKGLNPEDKRMGNGLFNMRNRAESLGGQFRVNSSKNKGTAVHCNIPIANISD